MRRWQIVLIAPKEAGNVGAAARVLKNFGAGGLVVVAPRCAVNSPDARRFSSGAAEILRGARVVDTLAEALADRELAIGLTGVSGKFHKLDCTGLIPAALLEGKDTLSRCALVFGREERGMTGEEMERCHFLWSLPTSSAFPSLNLAQAVGVALAGLAEAERVVAGTDAGRGLAPSDHSLNPLGGSTRPEDMPASAEDLARLSEHFRELMERTGWPNERRVRGSLVKIRNLFTRGTITRREVALFHGICRQALHGLERNDPGSGHSGSNK